MVTGQGCPFNGQVGWRKIQRAAYDQFDGIGCGIGMYDDPSRLESAVKIFQFCRYRVRDIGLELFARRTMPLVEYYRSRAVPVYSIIIGADSNVQEACALHTDPGFPLTLGENVTVGHQAMLHGCTIGAGSLIGIQAVVLNGARIGRNCLVGAGALITEGKVIPDNSLVIGAPARVARTLTEADIAGMHADATKYLARAATYRSELVRID
jgi:carbonic anhydrase/acetyltransferase-like protein (isoleucine patch superfamily)